MPTSIAARANLELIDQNYRRWQEDPASVDPSWSAFFEGFELGNLPQRNGAAATAAPRAGVRESPLQTRIDGLVYAYRTLGHTIARVNPLAEKRPENRFAPRVDGSRVVRSFPALALRRPKTLLDPRRRIVDGDSGHDPSQMSARWC